MWGFRSDIRVDAPGFDACPIYSASRRTDLRSTTSRHGRRDSPQMHLKLAPHGCGPLHRHDRRRGVRLAGQRRAADRVGGRAATTARSPSRSSASATEPTTSCSGRLVRGRHRRLAAQRRRQDRRPATRPTRSAARPTAARCRCPQGSAAVSPFTCVGLSEPTLRLFAKRNSALLGLVSTLNVQIQVKTSLGLSLWLPVLPGDLGGSSWHPTAADAADREHPAAVAQRQDARPLPLLRRCSAPGRSTTSTSIRS